MGTFSVRAAISSPPPHGASLQTPDAPGAQEPDEVRAVVDLPPSAAPGGLVDEDGEAVHPA